MEKIYIGKIVNTHGIKGEIRIISDFLYKEKAFKVNTYIYIDDNKYLIKSYRRHKNFEMITLDTFNDINDVIPLMKKKVYKDKSDLNLSKNELLDSELQQFKVIAKNGKSGIIEEIFYASPTNKVLRVKFDKEVLIPLNSPMITLIDIDKKIIEVELIEGMM